MTIFEIINLVLFNRKTDIDELNHESLTNFQPFLINRWLSFYNKTQACFVNETLNKYASIFQDKAEGLAFYCNLTPKQKFSRIQYVKKQKHEKKKESFKIPQGLNISQREFDIYIDLQEQLAK